MICFCSTIKASLKLLLTFYNFSIEAIVYSPEYLLVIPSKYDFLPTNIPIFITICDEWNLFKKQLLEKKGYNVIILKERHGEILRGVQIRNEIRQEKDIWMNKVPQATIETVDNNNIKHRLQNLGKVR